MPARQTNRSMGKSSGAGEDVGDGSTVRSNAGADEDSVYASDSIDVMSDGESSVSQGAASNHMVDFAKEMAGQVVAYEEDIGEDLERV
jgi:hypothetical protein